MKFGAGSAALYALFAAASCLAAVISTQQVIAIPDVTPLEAKALWPQGSRQIVRWNTEKIPKANLVGMGIIVLGYWSPESGDEHLDFDHPLASGFSLAGGSVEVEIPADILSREEYFVVLFGDSGSASSGFTIDQFF